MKHPARPVITGWINVPGIAGPVAVWSGTCADCDRPVRRMTGLSRPGSSHPVFWHASGPVQPGDPRHVKTPAHRAAISAGMKAATERRRIARSAR